MCKIVVYRTLCTEPVAAVYNAANFNLSNLHVLVSYPCLEDLTHSIGTNWPAGSPNVNCQVEVSMVAQRSFQMSATVGGVFQAWL